jgi:hypothetical protein
MDALINMLSANRRKKHAVERLRYLYADLQDLGRRGAQEDIFPSMRAPHFSLAWSLRVPSEKARAIRWNRIIVPHNEGDI